MEQKPFDLKVHHRDSKTGKITRVTPYIMKVSKERGTVFERDGREYYPDGTPVTQVQLVEQPAVVEVKETVAVAKPKASKEK